jgi:hypothetical protein
VEAARWLNLVLAGDSASTRVDRTLEAANLDQWGESAFQPPA